MALKLLPLEVWVFQLSEAGRERHAICFPVLHFNSFLKDEMQIKTSPCEDRFIAVKTPVSGCTLRPTQERISLFTWHQKKGCAWRARRTVCSPSVLLTVPEDRLVSIIITVPGRALLAVD